MKIMSDASGGAIDEDMRYFHSGYYDVGGQKLYVSRTGWTGELGYEIYSEGASTDHKRLWDHVMKAGIPHGLIHGCMGSMGRLPS
jgi:glycine cleavage system aminomethyltransferase T